MRFILFIFLCIFCTSCASMFNTANTDVRVRSSRGTNVTVDCVTKTTGIKGGQQFIINRSPDSLLITVSNDSITKEVKVKPIYSGTGYLNVLNLGLGFMKDGRSVKRFTYPEKIWIPLNEPGNVYYTQNPARKGMWGLHFSTPLFNSVYFRFGNDKDRVEILPLGFALGLNYGTSAYHYWSFEAGGAMNFDIMENFEDTVAQYPHWIGYANVMKNHLVRNFTLSYGLELSHYSWKSYDQVRNGPERSKINESNYSSTGLGPVLAAYFSPGSILAVGIKYHTQVLSYSDVFRLRYGHIISLEARLSFPFRKKFLYN